jgi:dihydrofolate reductase/thymidylate synthase
MSIIISINKHGLFGVNGQLAYNSNTDLSIFSRLTKTFGNVVMGSSTWYSLPEHMRPLPDRLNIIITRKPSEFPKQLNTIAVNSIKDVFGIVEEPCFIGGASILNSLFKDPMFNKISKMYITEFDDNSEHAKGIFIKLPTENFKVVSSYVTKSSKVKTYLGDEKMMDMKHITYSRVFPNNINLEDCYEKKYLDSMKKILDLPLRKSRNGDTYSMFGLQFKYDCSNGKVPLITTKQMAWKTCIKELLWFISGSTSNKDLVKNNVSIWTKNSSRKFLDSRGLFCNEEGDLGPVYGFQWRHFGACYNGCDTNYKEEGFDQLKKCEEMLKTDPFSRRIVMTAWNPLQLDEMALPPCHILIQWYVSSDKKLWLQFYQRSGDMFLGIPFNMFSYSVLLHIMSQRTGIAPGGVVHSIGDAHIYSNHIQAVYKQLSNTISRQPTIKIENKENWEEYNIKDFEIFDYNCSGRISAPMSA